MTVNLIIRTLSLCIRGYFTSDYVTTADAMREKLEIKTVNLPQLLKNWADWKCAGQE